MLTRLAVACFALYCVHGAQNSARDVEALAGESAKLAREAAAEAPRAALAYCLDHQATCAKAAALTSGPATVAPAPVAAEEVYPLPPRRPAAHKKA